MKRIKINFSKIRKRALSAVKGIGVLALLAFLVANITLSTSELAENAVAAKKSKVDPKTADVANQVFDYLVNAGQMVTRYELEKGQ